MQQVPAEEVEGQRPQEDGVRRVRPTTREPQGAHSDQRLRLRGVRAALRQGKLNRCQAAPPPLYPCTTVVVVVVVSMLLVVVVVFVDVDVVVVIVVVAWWLLMFSL